MYAPRPGTILLSLIAALGLVLAPMSTYAGGARPATKAAAKPLPPRTEKVAKKTLQGATKEQKTKAMSSLQSAMAARQDLRMSTTKQAAYLKRSVAAQKGAATRAAAQATNTKKA